MEENKESKSDEIIKVIDAICDKLSIPSKFLIEEFSKSIVIRAVTGLILRIIGVILSVILFKPAWDCLQQTKGDYGRLQPSDNPMIIIYSVFCFFVFLSMIDIGGIISAIFVPKRDAFDEIIDSIKD